MLFVFWLTVRLLTRLLVLPSADDSIKDLEILVLRHQLRVLRRRPAVWVPKTSFTALTCGFASVAEVRDDRQSWRCDCST